MVFAIIRTESGFKAKALSPKGAKGLMQIMDNTGGWVASKLGIEEFLPEMLFEPEINIRIGCWYIKNLLNNFDDNLNLALLAYNGGSGNVKQWLKNSNADYLMKNIPYKESEQFVKKVTDAYAFYSRYYGGR